MAYGYYSLAMICGVNYVHRGGILVDIVATGGPMAWIFRIFPPPFHADNLIGSPPAKTHRSVNHTASTPQLPTRSLAASNRYTVAALQPGAEPVALPQKPFMEQPRLRRLRRPGKSSKGCQAARCARRRSCQVRLRRSLA